MATKAPAKSITGNAKNLSTIVELYTEVNELSTELNFKKNMLKEETEILSAESRSIFNIDLGAVGTEEAPEVFGNHEYPVDGRLITVNYKMKAGGLTFTQVGGRSAHEVLPELIGEKEYKKLFVTQTTVKETDEKLEEVHSYRPDLVSHRFDYSKLPDEAKVKLGKEYPEAHTPYVVNEEAYVEAIKDAVTETTVTTGASFIEKVSKLSDESKFKLRDFIRKVLGAKATSAVKVGNIASA